MKTNQILKEMDRIVHSLMKLRVELTKGEAPEKQPGRLRKESKNAKPQIQARRGSTAASPAKQAKKRSAKAKR